MAVRPMHLGGSGAEELRRSGDDRGGGEISSVLQPMVLLSSSSCPSLSSALTTCGREDARCRVCEIQSRGRLIQ
jgi:hypothetical protein